MSTQDGPLPSSRSLVWLIAQTAPELDLTSSSIWPAFEQLLDALASLDAAIAERDRLEAELVAKVGYPRVALPEYIAGPNHYAADFSTIDQSLGKKRLPTRLRQRLRAELTRKRKQWREAAEGIGMNEAERAEENAVAETILISIQLLASPAENLPDLWLALAVIISAGQAGPEEATSFPWAALRKLLGDIAQLARGSTIAQ